MTSGRTSPALCGCENELGATAGNFVVKLRRTVQLRGLVNELLGAELATHFGISSPVSALITLEPKMAELIACSEPAKAEFVKESIGFNFGTQILIGFNTWPVDKQVPETMRGLAVNVFAFDALLQNPDRTYGNPNLLTSGDAIMIIDHELAFSFLRDISPSTAPWVLDRQPYLENHVFYRQLKSKTIDLTGFTARLRALSETVLDEIFADVPPEWNNEEDGLKIREHLLAIRNHAEDFAEQIRRFLA
ncbi:MAG TPA: HipA family kinase [Terracidiphilus sp.]|nr:HipA family kinase [Terracidiphilus sp.]